MIRPLNNRVLIKQAEQKSKTPSGIIIPEMARDKDFTVEGYVVSVAQGAESPLDVREGDRVLFEKRRLTELTVDEVPHYLVHIDQVLAVLDPEQ